MQLAFQQSGAAFNPITDKAVTAAFNRPNGGRNEPGKCEWPALLRKLDALEESRCEPSVPGERPSSGPPHAPGTVPIVEIGLRLC
jgi:hypothetical protein